MSDNTIDPTTGATTGAATDGASFFEALAIAWGHALDAEAQKITDDANAINGGSQDPSQLAILTAESQRMNFLANSESTSLNAVGDALDTLARKQ